MIIKSKEINFQYLSIPSPRKLVKNKSIIENNKKEELILMKKKLLKKNKSESVSSISSFSSSLFKLSYEKKGNKSIKNQLILSSENNSISTKSKENNIKSYINNNKKINQEMNKKNKSNSMNKYINVNKKNKSICELSNKSDVSELNIENKNPRYIFRKNILEKGKFIKKNIIYFHHPKKNSSHYNSNLIKNLKRKKQLSVNNSLSNSKKTILYHNKSSSRLANSVIENNIKGKTINKIQNIKSNQNKLNINNISKNISLNIKVITSNNSKPKIHSYSSKNNNKFSNKKKKNNSCEDSKKIINKKNTKYKANIPLLSLEKNLNNIACLNLKIKKMVSQSQKDILTLKKDILNSFNNYEIIFDEKNECKKQDLNKFIDSEIENKTQKNSKITIDSNLDEENEKIKQIFEVKKKNEQNLDEKIEEEEKKDKNYETNSEKLFINNLDKNEKNLEQNFEKNLEKTIENNSDIKNLEKELEEKEKEKEEEEEQTINSKINNQKEENKEESSNKNINLTNSKNIIPTLEKLQLTTKRQNTNSTLSSSNRDSNYYLTLSVKLSNYIKTYYLKYNTYPETSLSFYKYGRLIGQGAFGKVNLGLNILTGRIVAIKSFNKKALSKNNTEKKILYETDLMKQLDHPNITKILELFETEDYIFIILEYINGGNLFSFVKKRRKLSEKTAKFLFKQIIEGIKYIHSKNIVHRDIKLENILIDLKNNIKICDFGIGTILKKKNEKLFEQCGTPMYMAPEIYLSTKEKGYDPFLVDLWSCGIALYMMLSGNIPFLYEDNDNISNENNRNHYILRYNIINNEPKQIEDISNEANDLIMGLLNKNPKKRYNINDVLNHPWLKNEQNININKFHLFTKAEMIMLSKTYIDYRYAKIEDIKETFTISNLKTLHLKGINSNCLTKSEILTPYTSINDFNKNNSLSNINDHPNNDSDDFSRNNIKFENEIILFSNKVKEYNLNYELNNNGEIDNGILINTKSDNNSFSNLSINTLGNNNSYYFDDDFNLNLKGKINLSLNTFGRVEDENAKKERILKKIEDLGYNQNYVNNCLKKNILCHATAIFYLMKNYENI